MEDKIQQERKEIVYLKRENVCLKKEIEQLNIELNNKTGHVEQLLETERVLNREIERYQTSLMFRIYKLQCRLVQGLHNCIRHSEV